jgi:mannan endo-1,4-beta-mannosidase
MWLAEERAMKPLIPTRPLAAVSLLFIQVTLGCGGSTDGVRSGRDAAASDDADAGDVHEARDGGGRDAGELDDDASAARDSGADQDQGAAARAAKQRVLDYFAGIRGTRVLAGIENKFSEQPHGHSDELAGLAGRTPSFWGADFGFGGAVDHRAEIIAEARAEWSAGAVVAFMYHTCVPTRDEYCQWDDIGGAHPQHLSEAQWDELFTPGSEINAEWLRRLDILAEHFAELRAAGIAPLFRPFHEMNQCAFWWSCVDRENGSVKLWKTTHDYLVEQKGLDHIIWVWNVQDFASLADDALKYSPGSDYFDLASLDIYNTGYTTHNYDTIRAAAGGKPFGIGECQFLPGEGILSDQPDWTYFMLWPDFLHEPRNLDAYGSLFGSERVVTLDEMPGWQ